MLHRLSARGSSRCEKMWLGSHVCLPEMWGLCCEDVKNTIYANPPLGHHMLLMNINYFAIAKGNHKNHKKKQWISDFEINMISLWCFSETAVFIEEKRSGLEAEDFVGLPIRSHKTFPDKEHLRFRSSWHIPWWVLMRKNITQLLSSATFSHCKRKQARNVDPWGKSSQTWFI